jgi:hypothetical protein
VVDGAWETAGMIVGDFGVPAEVTRSLGVALRFLMGDI